MQGLVSWIVAAEKEQVPAVIIAALAHSSFL